MRTDRTLLSAAVALAVGLAAGTAHAATEIQWWHAMSAQLGETVDRIAADFNASQDEYEVKPVFKGDYTETMTAAIAAFRAGEHPHIVQVFEVGTATMMAAEGAVYPVHQLMADAGEPFDPSAYLPAVASYYTTPDGELLSLPFNSSTPILWYNKDAFTNAGLDPDSPPQTWAEMADAGTKLQESGMPCGLAVAWQSWVLIENMSAWHDQPIGTKENGFAGTDTEFLFQENDVVTRLVGDLGEWQQTKLFDYGGRRGDSLPKFITQECAMWISSSAYFGGIKKQAEFAFGMGMLPYYDDVVDGPQNSIIGGATLWVLQGRDEADYPGVAKFLSYVSSTEVQTDWHQSTGYVPITTAAYEATKSQGFYDENPGTDVAIQQLSLNQPTANSKGLRFGNFVQIRDLINDELEAVWAGDKSADDAMNAAAEQGDALLRKFERTN